MKHEAVGAALIAALVLAACSSAESTTTAAPTTAAAATPAPTTTAAPGTSAAAVETAPAGPDVSELVEYVGGTAGAASGEPIKIGWVNQQGGIPSFEQATSGAELAVDVINNQLGGIGGRPLELVTCFVTGAEEDGQQCGFEMLNNADVPFVALGTIVAGDGSLITALNGEKPTIGGPADTNADLVAPNSYFFNAGAPGVVQAMTGHAIRTYQPKTVAVLYVDNPAGQLVQSAIIGPGLDAAGIERIDIPLTQGNATYAPDVQLAADADLAILFGNDLDCALVAEAYQQTGIQQPVVTTFLCATDQVASGIDAGLADWTMLGLASEARVRDTDPQIETYWSLVEASGGDPSGFLGFAPQGFADLMTIAKLMNSVGVDAISAESMAAAAKNFSGPVYMGPPGLKCGAVEMFPAVCANTVSVSSYSATDGWKQLGGAPMVTIDQA
jgi:branched-chain amino acid transport system substrate-binding protein